MKRRACRITNGTAVTLAFLVAVLTATHWDRVCDHIEAWRFQATRKTGVAEGGGRCGNVSRAENLFLDLAALSGRPVIFAWDDDDEYDVALPGDVTPRGVDAVLRVLALNDYRVLEQRFPRRAFVVIRRTPPAQGFHSRFPEPEDWTSPGALPPRR